jgi:tetratricopeptide (TPR) repeat protein
MNLLCRWRWLLPGFASVALLAQHSGSGPSTGSPAGSTTGPPRMGNGTPTQSNNPLDSPSLDQSRPLFVMGKVVLDDGTPPPDPVAIQLVCRGRPRSIAYTDSKGNFSADLNSRTMEAVLADASQASDDILGQNVSDPSQLQSSSNGRTNSNGLSERNIFECELQASQPGFRSDVVRLGQRRSMDNPDVGTLFLHRLANVEGLTISATSALAPKDAKKAFEKARNSKNKHDWTAAEKELTRAVTIYPKYSAAWYALGNIQLEQKDSNAARQSYNRAIEADPKFVSPYAQLTLLAAREQNWRDVAGHTDQLLRLDPIDFPQAWLFNAYANFNLQNWEAAEKSAREGLLHDPAHHSPRLNQVLAAVLTQKHDYSGAVQSLRDYLQFSSNAPDTDKIKQQIIQLQLVLEPQANKQ